MKKIIVFLTTFCIMVSVFLMGVAAEAVLSSAYNETLFEDFDDISTLDGHEFITEDGGIASIIAEEGRGNVLYKTYPQNATHNMRVYLNPTKMMGASRKLGTLTYEFDIKVVDESDGTNNVDKGDYSVSYGFHVADGNTFAGRVHTRYNKITLEELSGTKNITEGSWNNIKVVYDYNGDNTTYKVYVNDSLFKWNMNLTESTYDPFEDKMAFHVYAGSNGRKISYYLDNIMVEYLEVEPSLRARNVKLTNTEGTSFSVSGEVVSNKLFVSQPYYAVLGGYKKGMLNFVDSVELSASYGESSISGVDFDIGDAELDYVKLFLWSDEILTPLCDCQQYYLSPDSAQRYLVEREGRYRIYGELAATSETGDSVITITKNYEPVWTQMIPEGETGVVDIRMLTELYDFIDIEVTNENNTDTFDWQCDIEWIPGTISVCVASTSQGASDNVISEHTLSSLIESASEKYLIYNYVEFPMTYDATDGKWIDTSTDSTAYITTDEVKPGSNADVYVDVAATATGTMRITGNLPVSKQSDGVLAKVYLNDELLWSNRTGGERSVRWDEPYDVSYFTNDINATAIVKEGDIITFSFGRWRTDTGDKLDISDIKISYIEGNPMTETTQWKLDKCTVAEEGSQPEADNIINLDNGYVLAYDGLPIFIGYPEISEIKADMEIKKAIEDGKLYVETFDNGEFDSNIFTKTMSSSVDEFAVAETSDGGKALKFAHGNASADTNLRWVWNGKNSLSAAPTTPAGKIVYEFDFKMINTTGVSETVFIKAGNKWESTTIAYMYPDKVDVLSNGSSKGYAVNTNDWGYRMKVIFDYTSSKPTASIYANNALLGTTTFSTSYSPYQAIHLGSYAKSGCYYYIDNAKVYYY